MKEDENAKLTTVINLIPDMLGIISNVATVFGGYFSIDTFHYIVTVAAGVIDIIEKVLFLALRCKGFESGYNRRRCCG